MITHAPRADTDTLEVPALAMNQREAAEALGVSERTLRNWTKAGTVPHCRLNGVLRYPTDRLLAWLESQTKGGDCEPTATP